MKRSPEHRIRAGLLLLALLVIAPGRALGHPVLRASAPAADTRVTDVPREVRLRFAEDVEPGLARVTVSGPAGVPLLVGPVVQPADSGSVLIVALQGDWRAGTYAVRWEVAGDDGHPVRGEFTFEVDPAALPATTVTLPVGRDSVSLMPGAPQSVPGPARFDVQSPPYVLVRWITYLGMLGVVGAAAFGTVVLPLARRFDSARIEPLASDASARAAALGLVSTGVLAGSAALRLLAQLEALGGVEGERAAMLLWGTQWGTGWLLQLLGAVLAFVGLTLVRRRAGRGWLVASAAAVTIAVSAALSGHAVGVQSWTAAAILADALHVLGAGGWMGGLMMVALAGLPAAKALDPSRRAPAGAALVGAFSPAALGFAAMTTMTGIFSAAMHLDIPSGLWTTPYGQVLLAKVSILSLLFTTAFYNWRRVKPALGTDEATSRLSRTVAAELAVAVVVLLVTAVLVATPPMVP